MNVILVLLGVCVLFLNLYKWLCIAQKEHYIAGSVSKIWTLWATKRTINTPIAIDAVPALKNYFDLCRNSEKGVIL